MHDHAHTKDIFYGRRLRGSAALRGMVRETRLSKDTLIYPVFVQSGENIKDEIATMPGQYRYSPDRLPEFFEEALAAGVDKVIFFGLPAAKDEVGSGAWADDGIVQQAVRIAAERYPEVLRVTDVCLCEYTSHGHCGVLEGGCVHNEKTLPLLAQTAVSQARAGAQLIAPSDMMDGRVAAIRRALDKEGFSGTPVMAYSAKYSSAFYGPFREAADSAPAFGDRKTYQMDWHNAREAVRESLADLSEGADIVMVKPALAYLDVIRRVREQVDAPLCAYAVSGEYAMIKAAAQAGMMDEEALVAETTTAIFRAGADMLITYHAPLAARLITEGRIG